VVQVSEVFAGGGPVINLAAAVGLLLGGAKLFQLFKGGGNGTAQLRRDLKEDHADQLELLAARLENMVKAAVHEAMRE